VDVADVRVADEDLAGVQDVVVAVADGAAGHAQDVPAGIRLGDGDGRQAVARRDGREPSSALGLGAEVQDLGHAELGGLGHRAHRGRDPGQFLDDDRLAEVPELHAAVLGRDRGADPAAAGDGRGQLVVDVAGVLHLCHPRPHVLLGESPDLLPHRLMPVVGEDLVHEC